MPPSAPTHAPEPAPSDEDAPILAIERFAALSADIEGGAARDEVIAREGLSVEAWTRAQESWLGKMAEEAARKRFELTNRYNTAFVAQRRSHDGSGRRASKKRQGGRGDVANVAPAPPPIAAPPAFVAPAPSFVAPPPRVSAVPFVAAPAPVVASPTPVAMPAFVAPAPVVISTPPVVVAPTPQNLGVTTSAQAVSPFASDGALPFVKSAAPFDSSEKPRSSALPPATPFERPSAHSAHPAPPAPSAKFDPNAVMDLSGTVSAEMISPIDLNALLPFRGTGGAGARPPPSAPPPPGASLQNLPFRAAAPAAKAPAAPIAPAAPAVSRAVRFTLEQFTSLSAEIAVTPSAVAQVRGRYGLDEASHRAEAEEWGRRFAADKELFARYSALFQSYRDWLARSTR